MHRKTIGWMVLTYLGIVWTGLAQSDGATEEPMAALAGQESSDSGTSRTLDWPTPVTFGVFSGDEGVFGQGDLLLPLYRYDRGLLFFNPRASISDNDQEETNLGIGMRHLFDTRYPFIFGANLYYDGRWSKHNNRFDQLGVGVELLSRRFDLRANYYVPEKDKYLIDSTRIETTTQTERANVTVDNWFEPYAHDNQILQDYGERITTSRALVTETSWQVFERYESALEGFDAEAGWRLPILENLADTRLYIGYQYFDNPFGDDFKGAKGRLEVRLFDELITLDAHLYEDEDLNLTDYIVGVRLRLPLGFGKDQAPSSSLASRLTEMVMRDPKIQTRESKFIANQDQQGTLLTTSETTTSRRTRTDGSAVVMDDVVFVDAASGNDSNPGTAQAPKATIQNGINNAYGSQMVYVYDGTYNTVITVNDGVTLVGSGCPISANAGHTFGSGVAPVINGGGAASVVTLKDNTRIQGFEITNGGAGNGIFSDASDLIIACNYIHDTLVGVRVDRVGDLNVSLLNNRLVNNGTAGAWISGNGVGGVGLSAPAASGTYFVNASGNTFADNGTRGLHLTAENYEATLAVVHDSMATGSQIGIHADLYGEALSLLSITDTQVEGNTDDGIRANISSDFIAAALFGMPSALLGLTVETDSVSPQTAALMTSSGPVTANNNGDDGIELNIQGGVIGAAVMFDVAASNNGEDGADINVDSTNGVAIGLLASSQNTMEFLELGADLLNVLDVGLTLPELPVSPVGPCVFEGNGDDGVELNVHGGMLALGGALGIDAQQNGEDGVDMSVLAEEGVAIGLLSRIDASDNVDDGIEMGVLGYDLAIGLVLDARANNNGGDGIDFGSYSDYAAIGIMASSDPLRTVAELINAEEILDQPLVIPGDPWGPIEASGNGGYGIYAEVWGWELAAGVFLDINADNNENTGFSADIWSPAGGALGFAASSDVLFDIIPPILGELMFDDVAALSLPPIDGMGPMSFSGNGNGGFEMFVEGESAIGLAGGIEANNNLLGDGFDFDYGQGLYLGVTSTDGHALAALYDVTANNNAEQGIDVYVESETDYANLALINLETEGNAEAGIRIEMVSEDDAYLLLTGAEANNNGAQGVEVTIDSGLDFGMAVSAANATGNTEQGLLVNASVWNESEVWISPTAVDDFRAVYGSYEFLGTTNAIYSLMPSGASSFSGNGGADTELNL